MLDIINYIRESIRIIIQIKAQEEVEKYKAEHEANQSKENEKYAEDYETLLRREEAEIRQHISIEHQFRIQFDNLLEKIDELEDDNYFMSQRIVRKYSYYFIYLILQEKQRKKYEYEFKELKSQLHYINEQKEYYKNNEKNLKNKINSKEKEVNELKSILNTNISIKSQITSLLYDGKDEETSKEIREYEDNRNTLNRKQLRPKSLSKIEKKISSFKNSISRRNMLPNNSNKSYNSNNNSSKFININSKNMNKQKMDYKYKTIANMFVGNSVKRKKNTSTIRINKNMIKPSYHSNYHCIHSLREKKLDKSDSRSSYLRKGNSKSKINIGDELNNSKNKSHLNSNLNKNESDNLTNNKNKILINYNTNIINTNVSIEKLTVKQKMKDIRKAIDEKISEITRNKKTNLRRNISAIFEKSKNIPIFNEKFKTKREPTFRYNRLTNNKINSDKLEAKTNKNYNQNKYNSKMIKQQLQNFTIQHKNKNKKMQKYKAKLKSKSNSMFNIRNSNEETDKNTKKAFSIQAYSYKKKDEKVQLFKNNDYKIIKIRKGNSIVNLNNKIIFEKNANIESSIKTNINHKTILSNKKNKNFKKISLFHEKLLKNNSKSKSKIADSNNHSNKMNSSLVRFMFNKCISNSNIS